MPTKTTTEFEFKGCFFGLTVQTDDTGMGNSHRPTTLKIRADQTDEVAVNEYRDGVSISFTGQLEFNEFCDAIAALAETLKPLRGRAMVEDVQANVVAFK